MTATQGQGVDIQMHDADMARKTLIATLGWNEESHADLVEHFTLHDLARQVADEMDSLRYSLNDYDDVHSQPVIQSVEPHREFDAFLERALSNPETKAAYEEATKPTDIYGPLTLGREGFTSLGWAQNSVIHIDGTVKGRHRKRRRRPAPTVISVEGPRWGSFLPEEDGPTRRAKLRAGSQITGRDS